MNHPKSLLPIALILVGCASERQPVTERVDILQVPGTTLPESTVDAVRNPEIVKEYGLNPYPDPADPEGLRHDAHKVQRVEKKATWELYNQQAFHPNTGPSTPSPDPAKASNPYMAQLEQELEKQRGYTAAAIEQARQMDEGLTALKQQAETTRKVIQENTSLKEQLATTNQKIREIEKKEEESSSKTYWQKFLDFF